MSIQSRYDKIAAEVKRMELEQSRAEGQLQSALDSLVKLGFTSQAQAKTELQHLEKSIPALEAEIESYLTKLENLLGVSQ